MLELTEEGPQALVSGRLLGGRDALLALLRLFRTYQIPIQSVNWMEAIPGNTRPSEEAQLALRFKMTAAWQTFRPILQSALGLSAPIGKPTAEQGLGREDASYI